MQPAEPQSIPAATLVIVRETSRGPELLMVERAAAMRFAGGALVFPGGRVDPGDHDLARRHAGDAADLAARIAAIRETIEEVGLAPGVHGAIDMPRARAALADGATMADVLGPATLDLASLIPFTRWRPPGDVTHRMFDTRFYLARLPDGAPDPVADGGESVRLLWAGARAVLADADTGTARIIFPTRCNLQRLAQFDSFDAMAADARAHPVATITPWIEPRGGEPHLCIPDGHGYPITAQRLSETVRG
jgi:8-oxo-dGTP pyrophosphatase MutT (NUDIX family)